MTTTSFICRNPHSCHCAPHFQGSPDPRCEWSRHIVNPIITPPLIRTVYEPTKMPITEAALEQIMSALQSGLEVAQDNYGSALENYGSQKPLRVQFFLDEVTKIETAIETLRRECPELFPVKNEVPSGSS